MQSTLQEKKVPPIFLSFFFSNPCPASQNSIFVQLSQSKVNILKNKILSSWNGYKFNLRSIGKRSVHQSYNSSKLMHRIQKTWVICTNTKIHILCPLQECIFHTRLAYCIFLLWIYQRKCIISAKAPSMVNRETLAKRWA